MIPAISNRLDYPCLQTHSYLNQASLGLIGEASVSAMHEFLEETARHGNLKMSDKEEAAFLDPLRSRIGKLINANKDNIAVVASASEILSQLPYLISPPSGTKVIFVSTDFPAITRPWISYSEKNQCEVCFVEENEDQSLVDKIIQELDENTSAVCVSYVQFSSGTRLNIEKLRAATNSYGTKLVVDITQAAGAVPISVRDWNADIVVCSGYKWLGGHGGIAFASFSDQLLAKQPICIGWFGGHNPFDMDATRLTLSKTAAKYTQSTISYISVVSLNESLDALLKIGIDKIDNHSRTLAKILISGLKTLDWKSFRTADNEEASNHIITLKALKLDAQETLKRLEKNRIICSMRNGRIRVSIAHYNNENDINTLLENLKYKMF